MKSATVKVRPGDKNRLSKSDPDDTSKMTKEEPHGALSIYTMGLILFLSIERPFLQLRHRIAARS
jgi:hypothetical protein